MIEGDENIYIIYMAPTPEEINLSYRHDLPQTNGARQGFSLTAPLPDADFVLRAVLEELNITPGKLGRLVGKSHNNVYKWFTGRYLPSQVYWVRISYLQILATKLRRASMSLRHVRTIDWSKRPYRIEWWPGANNGLVDDFGNILERPSTPSTQAQTLRETWLHDIPLPDDPAPDDDPA